MTTLRKDKRHQLHEVATALLRAKSADDEHPVSIVEMDFGTLRTMGKLIYRVSQGEDARKVFKQAKRHESKLKTEARYRAMARRYFGLQVLHRKKEKEAAAFIEAEYGLKASSVAKITRPYREGALAEISRRDEQRETLEMLIDIDGKPPTPTELQEVYERNGLQATPDELQHGSKALVIMFTDRTAPYATNPSEVGQK